jgi:hypothetical protein
MLTALIYAVNQRSTRADEAALRQARDEGYKEGVKCTNANNYEKQYRELHDKIAAFEKTSGLNIQYGWSKPEKVGVIVKMLLDGDAPLKRILETAKYNLSKTVDLKTEIEKQIVVLETALSGTLSNAREEDEAE